MVEARERTVTELTAELFPTAMTAAQRHFAMAEILAYLAHHEVREVLARARRPGRGVRVAAGGLGVRVVG